MNQSVANTRFLLLAIILGVAALHASGCGSGQTVMPTGELTEEQKLAVRAEDAAIEDEESQGRMAGGKPVKKK